MPNRGHHKSGVPDGEQDKVFGAPVRKGPSFTDNNFKVLGSAVRKGQIVGYKPFEGLGAKHFEGLAASDSRDGTFKSVGSVGINNLEFVRWEEEQDVLPGSHTSESDSSACLLYSPTVCRRGVLGTKHAKIMMCHWAQPHK